jgi:hypothetical protein
LDPVTYFVLRLHHELTIEDVFGTVINNLKTTTKATRMFSDRLLSILPSLEEQPSNANFYNSDGKLVRPMIGEQQEQQQMVMLEILPPHLREGRNNDALRNNNQNTTPAQQHKQKFPVCLHQVEMEIRYDPFRHEYGPARFLAEEWQRQQQQDRDNNNDNNNNPGMTTITTNNNYHIVTILSVQRKSQLALWVMVLIQLVSVDVYWLLPTGVILYAVTLQIAWEQWMNEILENQQYQEQQKLQQERQNQRRQMKLQKAIQKAEFEYHVLQDQWDIEIIPVYEPDNGRTIVYAVPPSKTMCLSSPDEYGVLY